MEKSTETILVIGANGQLGTELTEALRAVHGNSRVIAADVSQPHSLQPEGPFQVMDVLDKKGLGEIIRKNRVTQIYHLAALLSATGEKKPMLAWQVNVDGLINVLEACRELGIAKLFWPSTIAVFGTNTPRQRTPQYTVTDPVTVYGISKLAGERWCEYYHAKHGIDVRGLRYPGLISYKNPPGGGTTDYAIDIFQQALEKGTYQCYLAPDTYLPMMYMPDAVRGTLQLMEAEASRITVRSSYNLGAISFSPSEIAEAIRKYIPDFTVSYQPDFRQQIAESWPSDIDDSQARQDWGWKPQYDLPQMTRDMLVNMQQKLKQETVG